MLKAKLALKAALAVRKASKAVNTATESVKKGGKAVVKKASGG